MTIQKENHTISDIPVIDLGGMKDNLKQTADQVLHAAKNIGFLFVRIPSEQKEHLHMFEKSKEFFALPTEDKMKYLINPETNLGYSAMRQEMVDTEHVKKGDFKESLNLGRLINGEPQQDLAVFADHMDTLRQFQARCNSIVCDLMECLAVALKIPEENGGRYYFSKRYLNDSAPQDVIRLLHYPPMDDDTNNDDNSEGKDIRIGRHSDYGMITLLWQSKVGGLQIQSNNEMQDPTKMSWLDVPVLDDCLVVNVGDCLQYWTNGYLKSTKHRVVFKPNTEQTPRYSMAYFVQGGEMALDPVPSALLPSKDASEAIEFKTSTEYLKYRLSVTYGGDY
ncbi:hypothetical protein BCR42DRAFT_426665 [Absidia repens]|uniref:Fe2OG dioxygenase domain-containing protein n=1 Tax=Absidia repens TaxID=90262 RepID=A0A1X2I0Q7_9FUNG|nr:hypothetical protein BCR42DRAFT_426665 [Absidia repens]